MRQISLCLLLLTSLVLTGCGFKLRSQAMLPSGLKRLYLSSKVDYSRALPKLKTALSAAGVEIVNNPQQAHYHLNILDEGFSVSQSTQTAASTTVSAYIYFTMHYNITDNNKKIVFGPMAASHYEIIMVDANQLQSSKSAEADIKQSVMRQALTQVMNQLTSPMARARLANEN